MTSQCSAWPYFAEDEIAAVTRVLKSGKVNYWTGDECRQFEQEFADFCGVKYAIALANGTVALELALYALGVGPGDEVIVTPRTFIASASCIVLRGATPVFADVDPDSQNITAASIRPVITAKTKAIIAVHLAGWPCEMDKINALAEEHDLYVIEDCAQAHGATYQGKAVGSWGHMAAFSFCQDKIMSTGGEGGMLLTNDKNLWEIAWSYKDHGKSYEAVYERQHPPGFRWLHESFGTNWRMTEMQAAIGRIQLRKLPEWIRIRQAHAQQLTECCKSISALRVAEPPAEIGHAYYKYYVFVKLDYLKTEWSREDIIEALQQEGIPCLVGSCSEIYLEKAFQNFSISRLPAARELGETGLMLLVHPTLESSDIERACVMLKKVFAAASQA